MSDTKGCVKGAKYTCATCCATVFAQDGSFRKDLLGWTCVNISYAHEVHWLCPDCDFLDVDGKRIRIGAEEFHKRALDRRTDVIGLLVALTVAAFILGGLIL